MGEFSGVTSTFSSGVLGNKLRAAMRGGASDDGMLARFGLLVWPETGGLEERGPLPRRPRQ
jgi:hypothetical protein